MTRGNETGERIRAELEESSIQFHALLDSLTAEDWNAPSRNPAWTNGQLLFHMVFAFMLVPALFWMIRFWSRLPDRFSLWFARVLDFSTPVFNWFNALGPRGQAVVFGRRRIGAIYDRAHRSILRKIDSLGDDEWSLGMHYPRRWDPAFGDFMTFEDLFRYPTRHFSRHLRHLSAGRATSKESAARLAARPFELTALPSAGTEGANERFQRTRPEASVLLERQPSAPLKRMASATRL